ncbi:unnamed protein product [Oikopleura dioica]|uniref:Uncharacterized protein n=1 Tax=Oikopleura dioica TaxID=34765 RepID=E4X2D7_OIKDI|nr:unnamed protein product [Oikopleura dioica]
MESISWLANVVPSLMLRLQSITSLTLAHFSSTVIPAVRSFPYGLRMPSANSEFIFSVISLSCIGGILSYGS